MMQSMYLNMDEINKLNPPRLLNLRPMLFVVEVMMGLIAKEVPGSRMMLKLVRALGRYQKQVRENEAYNLNVKIKAWVLAQAERRAWVRGIIGEAAIRAWQVRYDNLAHPVEIPPKRHNKARAAPRSDVLPYQWKRFAMADISWQETRPFPTRDTSLPTLPGSWQQPRKSRGFKPVEFYPFELAADYEPPDYRQETPQTTNTHDPTNTKPDPPPEQGGGADVKIRNPKLKNRPKHITIWQLLYQNARLYLHY